MLRKLGIFILLIGVSVATPKSNFRISHKAKSKLIDLDDYSGNDYSGDMPIIMPKINKYAGKKHHSKNHLMGKNASLQTLGNNESPKNNANIAFGISGGIVITMSASLITYRKYKMRHGHKLINKHDNYSNYNTL